MCKSSRRGSKNRSCNVITGPLRSPHRQVDINIGGIFILLLLLLLLLSITGVPQA
jgi:hypothetical protein